MQYVSTDQASASELRCQGETKSLYCGEAYESGAAVRYGLSSAFYRRPRPLPASPIRIWRFGRADAGGVSGRAEIIDKSGVDDEEADAGLIVIQISGFWISAFLIISYGGVVGLRSDFR